MPTLMSTRTLTVNAAFLQEIKEVHMELWSLVDRLRHRMTRPIALRSETRDLVESMGQLRDLLALHFSLEEACGYFEDPVEVAPRLSDRAVELRDEHSDLYLRACRMAELGEALYDRRQLASLVTQLSDAFQDFDRRLRLHEEGEAELIQAALMQDIGVGD